MYVKTDQTSVLFGYLSQIPSEVASAASTRDPMNTNGVKCEWLVEPTRSEAKRNTVSAPNGFSREKQVCLEDNIQVVLQSLKQAYRIEKDRPEAQPEIIDIIR